MTLLGVNLLTLRGRLDSGGGEMPAKRKRGNCFIGRVNDPSKQAVLFHSEIYTTLLWRSLSLVKQTEAVSIKKSKYLSPPSARGLNKLFFKGIVSGIVSSTLILQKRQRGTMVFEHFPLTLRYTPSGVSVRGMTQKVHLGVPYPLQRRCISILSLLV